MSFIRRGLVKGFLQSPSIASGRRELGFGSMNRVTLIGNVGQDVKIIRLGEPKETPESTTSNDDSTQEPASSNTEQPPEKDKRENTITEIARFDLATSQMYRNRTGEVIRGAEWHHISIYNPVLRDFASKFIKKGTKVYVEGRLRYRRFVDEKSNERTITEIVLGRDGNIQILSRIEPEGEMD